MSQENILTNPSKERMRAGGVSLGMIVRLARSAEIARIAKTTGHDFIFIDGQHALFSVETVGHIAQTALAIGVAPLVRVRSCDDPSTSAHSRQRGDRHHLPRRELRRRRAARGQRLQVPAGRQALGRRRLPEFRLPSGAADAGGAGAQRTRRWSSA